MTIYEESNGSYSLVIRQDENPISPRQMDANIGRMICFHSRYYLGDRHDYANKDEFLLDLLSSHFMDEGKAHTFFERLDNSTSFIPPFASEKLRDDIILKELSEDHVFLPLYLLDHSGLSMSTTSFGDPWDSGQVGWIYASKATVIEEYGEWSEETIAKVKEFMKGEVSTYDDYLRGENYIYDIIDDSTGEVIDGGVWTGSLEDLKEDARDMIPEPLSDEEYNKLSLALATKLRSEYDAFVEETKKLTPQEIVDRAYQLTFKYDLMATVNDCDFSREEFKALLNAPNALETMYNEWIYLSNNLDENLEYCCHKAAHEAQIAYPIKGGEAR
jgi:hypothetical protein